MSRVMTTAAARRGRPIVFVPGLLLGALAVFLAPLSLRALVTLATRGAFVRDQFAIAHVTDSRMHTPKSFGGTVVSTGEPFVGLDAAIVGTDVLTELQRAGRLSGHRVPVYYLPPTGVRNTINRIIRFRVQSTDEFEAVGSGVALVNLAMAVAAGLLVHRGIAR